MNINEIAWHLGRVEGEYEANVKRLETLVKQAETQNKRFSSALIVCRNMLEQALPHIAGHEIEKDFRIYLNIVSDVIGDFGYMNVLTPEQHGKWLDDQFNKWFDEKFNNGGDNDSAT